MVKVEFGQTKCTRFTGLANVSTSRKKYVLTKFMLILNVDLMSTNAGIQEAHVLILNFVFTIFKQHKQQLNRKPILASGS